MKILYEFVLAIFCFVHIPIFLFKRKFHEGFLLRLGFLPDYVIKKLKGKKYIWIHAVSVGEAMVASRLISALRKVFSVDCLVISTVTATGNRIANSLAEDGDAVIYLPLDFGFIVNRMLKNINPMMFITTETEIWPNIISAFSKKAVPIALINGRISDSSFKGYKAVKWFFKDTIAKINLFCMQNQRDMDRIVSLGAQEDKVHVVGNMKFDETSMLEDFNNPLDLYLDKGDILFIAGSTHPGEEDDIISCYKKLIKEFPRLRLLLAPRHLERLDIIENIIKNYGFETCKFSSIESFKKKKDTAANIILLDTIGELSYLYSSASIVFIGGSLVKKGGHNIIEPAKFGKPILFGPFMYNFQDIADQFVRFNAAIRISTKEELEYSIRSLLKDNDMREHLGIRAREAVERGKGATSRTIDFLKKM